MWEQSVKLLFYELSRFNVFIIHFLMLHGFPKLNKNENNSQIVKFWTDVTFAQTLRKKNIFLLA